MPRKTVRELQEDVEALQRMVETLINGITVLADTITLHKDQIASLQASNLMLTNHYTLSLEIAGTTQPDLRAYQ